jgi:hypothetical protein
VTPFTNGRDVKILLTRSELSDRPRYEVRYTELPDTGGAVVFHRRYFDGEIVDLIEITVID